MPNTGKGSSRSDVSDLFGRDVGADKPKTHKQDAIDYYGTTPDFHKSFYMLDDGRYLNGTEPGGDYYGHRTLDHRNIGILYPDIPSDGGNKSMNAFMDEGNIRLQPETRSMSIRKKPTESQLRNIMSLARQGKLDMLEIVKNPNWTPDNVYLEDIMTPGQVMSFLNDAFGI